jgi:translation initiation factor IF-3
MIRISPVRLITAEGEQKGVVPLDRARQEADETGLDLVEVAPNARPPVVRIMDWGKFQFDQQKRAKESRRKQHTVDVKEVKLRPRTDDHDLGFKLRNARRFLDKGNSVKFTVRFRGPELRRPELGQQVLDTVVDELDDVATVASRSRGLEGRQLTMMLTPERSD